MIGLSTAVHLAEGGQRVEVRSRLAPGQTTSAVASAMVGPALAAADEAASRRERASIAEFVALAEASGTGVSMRRGRLASREPVPALGDLAPCAAEELPPGFAAGFWTTLPLVDMPRYLDYLSRRLAAASGRIVLGTVTSLRELAAEVPLIVNCAGLGAGDRAARRRARPVAVIELEQHFPHRTPGWIEPSRAVAGSGSGYGTSDAAADLIPKCCRSPAPPEPVGAFMWSLAGPGGVLANDGEEAL